MIEIDIIQDWHAHVYFDAQSVEQARTLCEEAARRFDLQMGRVHEKPIGPHPCWSCQLAFQLELFDKLVPWLNLNRGSIDVLVHPQTGDNLADHRDRAIWLGHSYDLNLSIF
jgi:aromatic ring-cleaving dioxygenase